MARRTTTRAKDGTRRGKVKRGQGTREERTPDAEVPRLIWRRSKLPSRRGLPARAYLKTLDGGKLRALRHPRTGASVTDEEVELARDLARQELGEQVRRERTQIMDGFVPCRTMSAVVNAFLETEAERRDDHWLTKTRGRLAAAVTFFRDRPLHTITERDVLGFSRWLQRVGPPRPGDDARDKNGQRRGYRVAGARPAAVSPATALKYLWTLSALYGWARIGFDPPAVPAGYNPVRQIPKGKKVEGEDKLTARDEPDWLEPDEAALLLEAVRVTQAEAPAHWNRTRCNVGAVATMLYTGGGPREVFGLTVGDVNFERKTVTFRPNVHRGLKTSTRPRVVPLFPELEAILRPYVFAEPRPDDARLFTNARGAAITSVTGALDEASALLRRLGVASFAHVRREAGPNQYDLRHTFCAAALQLLDHGAPISADTVARWMGHGGHALVRRVYGHLGTFRHRGEAVSFALDLARRRFADAVRALRARGRAVEARRRGTRRRTVAR